MTSEGYTIVLADESKLDQVELLAYSIKQFDSTRPIAAIVDSLDIDSINNVDEIIYVSKYVAPHESLRYFHHVKESPFDRSICLMPNQLLTSFNIDIWENLRTLGAIVLLKNTISFNYEPIPDSYYWAKNIEKNTFGTASILNIGYYNKDLGSDDICGFAADLITKYNHKDYISWIEYFKTYKSEDPDDLALPSFPEYLWSSWVMGLLCLITDNKIYHMNFVNNIDLSTQDSNPHSMNHQTNKWYKYLSYWVNKSGELRIENFIQRGLITYDDSGWLISSILENIYGKEKEQISD